MENLPSVFLEPPAPLVFIEGHDVNFAQSLISSLSQLNIQSPPLVFRGFTSPNDLPIPMRRFAKSTNTIEYGAIRNTWISKYTSNVPSVVIHFSSFNISTNIDWDINEYRALKSITDARDVKIIVLAVVTVAEDLEHEVIEERISMLQKKIGIAPRQFILFSISDLSITSTILRRLYKLLRDLSQAFYNSQMKQIKSRMFDSPSNIHRSVLESFISIKYNFKLAYYSEFLGPTSLSIRFYKQCYQVLLEVASTVHVEQDMNIIKSVAEWVNYKICYLFFLSNNTYFEATHQFKYHISMLTNLYVKRSFLCWMHPQWLSQQYLLFGELLLKFRTVKVEEGGGDKSNMNSIDLDVSYYFEMSAKYTLARSTAYKDVIKMTGEQFTIPYVNLIQSKYEGYTIQPSRFLGAFPILIHANLPLKISLVTTLDSQDILYSYMQNVEASVDHNSLALAQFQLSLRNVHDKYLRRKALIKSYMADVEYYLGNYQTAMEWYVSIVNRLLGEQWSVAAGDYLKKLVYCAKQSHRDQEFISYGLKLYSLAVKFHSILPPLELMELHNDIFTKLQANNQLFTSSNPMASFYGLSTQYELPLTSSMNLLDIQVTLTPSVLSVGHPLTVSLQFMSKFQISMKFCEISVYFSDDITMHRLVNTDEEASQLLWTGYEVKEEATTVGATSTTASTNNTTKTASSLIHHTDLVLTEDLDIYCPLIFPPNTPVVFTYTFLASEQFYGATSDPCRYIQKVTCSLPLPLSSPGSNTATPAALIGGGGIGVVGSEYEVRSRRQSDARSRQESMQMDDVPRSITSMSRPQSSRYEDLSTSTHLYSSGADGTLASLDELGRPLSRKLSHTTIASSESQYLSSTARDVVFICDHFPPMNVMKLHPKTPLMELIKAYPSARCNYTYIHKPESQLKIVQPAVGERVSLLQGLLRCIPVEIHTGEDIVKDGFLYLESSAPSPSDPVFWYPTSDSVDEASTYHALRLSTSSYQPSFPFKLPLLPANSTFTFPLYVRTVLTGELTLNLKISYISNAELSEDLVVTKHFEVKCSVAEPLRVKFGVSGSNMHPRGVSRDILSNSVVRGDVLTVCASLECPFELKEAIHIKKLHLYPNYAGNSEAEEASQGSPPPSAENIFSLCDDEGKEAPSGDMLRGCKVESNVLHGGEVAVGAAYLTCSNKAASSGKVLMNGLKATQTVFIGSVEVELSAKDMQTASAVVSSHVALHSAEDSAVVHIDLRQELSKEYYDSLIDSSFTSSSSSNMVFYIPAVQVIDCPFEASIDVPINLKLGESFQVVFTVKNKLKTLERVFFKVDSLEESFLLNGNLSSALDIPPGNTVHFDLFLVPLSTGFCALPHVIATWETDASTSPVVLEIGGLSQNKLVYIAP